MEKCVTVTDIDIDIITGGLCPNVEVGFWLALSYTVLVFHHM